MDASASKRHRLIAACRTRRRIAAAGIATSPVFDCFTSTTEPFSSAAKSDRFLQSGLLYLGTIAGRLGGTHNGPATPSSGVADVIG